MTIPTLMAHWRRTTTVGVSASVAAVVALAGCGSISASAKHAAVDEAASGGAAIQDVPSTQAAPLPPAQQRKLTILGSGDLMIHPSVAAAAESAGSSAEPDFFPLLADVKARVSAADFAVCHVETPFSQPGVRTEFPHYYVHPNLATAIAEVGFDECSTASNWTADKGIDGARRTAKALAAAGVGQSGINLSAQQSRVRIQTVDGVKVAHLSYTDPADSPTLADAPWMINEQRPAQIVEDARTAKAQGAEVVVVSLAMGSMGSDEASGAQRQAVKKIASSGDVNLIIGHGSHTIQPAEKINNTWVIWHGNLISSFFPDQPNMHVGLISTVTLREGRPGEFAPVAARGYPVLSLPQAGHVDDLAAMNCGSGQYASYWAHVRDVESSATKQGFSLGRSCGG